MRAASGSTGTFSHSVANVLIQPLTDIFAPNAQSLTNARQPKSAKPVAGFVVAEDNDSEHERMPSKTRLSAAKGKENTDSGYHEMSDEESQSKSPESPSLHSPSAKSPLTTGQHPQMVDEVPVPRSTPTQNGVSLKTDHEHLEQSTLKEPVPQTPHLSTTAGDLDVVLPVADVNTEAEVKSTPERFSSAPSPDAPGSIVKEVDIPTLPLHEQAQSQQQSPSSESTSPARTLLRKKSSLNFASLPAREPLTTKKSVGPGIARNSQISSLKGRGGTSDYFGMSAYSKDVIEPQDNGHVPTSATFQTDALGSPRIARKPVATAPVSDLTNVRTAEEELRAQSRASTMRLQERLAMLGKPAQPRLSRSVPSTVIVSQTIVQQSPNMHRKDAAESEELDEDLDDWIGPMSVHQTTVSSKSNALKSPALEQVIPTQNTQPKTLDKTPAAAVRTNLPTLPQPTFNSVIPTAPVSPTKVPILPYPRLDIAKPASTTPFGSPVVQRHNDGPLSASKAKLQSVLKSARGIFSSTAGLMGHGTKETAIAHNHHPSSPLKQMSTITSSAMSRQPLLPDQDQRPAPVSEVQSVRNEEDAGRRRSSQRLALKKLDSGREKGSELQTRQMTAEVVQEAKHESFQAETQIDNPNKHISATLGVNAAPSSPARPQEHVSQLPKPGDARRLLRPNKEALKAPARPAPVSIKLASQRVCVPSSLDCNSTNSVPDRPNRPK